MSDQPTQTTPKGETIPVPKREDVMEALRKGAKVKSDVAGEEAHGDSSR